MTRAQAASHFFDSPEFSAGGLYVIKLYLAVLGRDPDYSGWAFWAGGLTSGVPENNVLNSFLSSPEFQTTYGNLSNAAFLNLVYQNVLGRAPDSGGLTFYSTLLGNGNLTRSQVMDQFVRSPEFDSRVRARAYANLLHMGFLRRTPDAGGLAFWINSLANPNALASAIPASSPARSI